MRAWSATAYRSIRLPLALLSAGLAVALVGGPGVAQAQDPAAGVQTPSKAAPRQSGTVKSVAEHDFVLTGAANQEFAVHVPENSHVLLVPPGSRDLSSAKPAGMKDIQPGDKAIVTGTVGDSGPAMQATRVILMKANDIEASHAAQASAWAQGGGGIVKSVDASAGTVVISSGLRTVTVQTTPQTIVRRYAEGSIKFEDAAKSNVAAIQPGDQLRVRGAKSPDGSTINADEIVTGSFRNFSGVLQSVDANAGTVTLKDLATKKTVTVSLTPNSDVRRIDPQRAGRIAMSMRGGAPGAAGGANGQGGQTQAGGQTALSSAAGNGPGRGPGGAPGTAGEGQSRAGRAGMDLSAMLSRLPTETISGLKPGEAVMIVASSTAGQADKGTAITLLVGVDPILAAPAGAATTLSPWNVSGGGEEMGGVGGATP